MNIYSKKQTWKFFLLLFAVSIGVSSLFYTQKLVECLSAEERKKVELWAEATRQLAGSDAMDMDINFLVRIIQDNETVPVILTNKDEEIISYRNLDTTRVKQKGYLQKQLARMKKSHEPIEIVLGDDNKNYIFYKDSTLLNQLYFYPFIQLVIIIIFIFISYYAFSLSRRAEQNQVWVGMSKETAHQLGTPTSSLIAWVEMLRMRNVDETIVAEIEKDVNRLEKITERFSKIGSKPVLKNTNISDIIKNIRLYLSARLSEQVTFLVSLPDYEIIAPVNASLFEWVLENVCKNAYDAISGKGTIHIVAKKKQRKVIIDINDSGKGIPKSKYKTIFKPGFTTKAGGWGLGLSLSKRIIENYHNGKIFVHSSESGKGTTIRIIINSLL